MDSTQSKICTRCRVEKPLDAFGPLKTGRFGRAPGCKTCMAAASRAYAAANREVVAQSKKAYRASPKGRATAKAYMQRYELEHAEELRAKRVAKYHDTKHEKREWRAQLDKEYRERNREAIKARRSEKLRSDTDARQRNIERSAAWYQANKDAALQQSKMAYQADRENRKMRVAAYQRANPELTRMHHRVKAHRRRQRLREAGGHFTSRDVEKLMRLQRGMCACCKASLASGFHIDHRIPVARGGSNEPSNLELLCRPCNLAKAAKLPHEFAQEQGRLL